MCAPSPPVTATLFKALLDTAREVDDLERELHEWKRREGWGSIQTGLTRRRRSRRRRDEADSPTQTSL